MAFDGLTTAAVVNELSSTIIGSRIDKIYQPQSSLVFFRLRQKRENIFLLISAHPVNYRLHLTKKTFLNPQTPPMFCMVLRKHLEGGKIISITQPELERQIIIEIENKDELGRIVKKILICELMGKHSNIILLNSDQNTIIDALKRYSYAVNSYRQIIPGENYKTPPNQNKIDPRNLKEGYLQEKLLSHDLDKPVWKALLQIIAGFGPETCREIISRAGLSQNLLIEECGEYELNRLEKALFSITEKIISGQYNPIVIKKNNKYIDFSPLNLKRVVEENKIYFPSISKAIDEFYSYRESQEKLTNLSQSIQKVLQKEIKRCNKKAKIQKETIQKAKSAEKYKLYGELITANIYQVEKGMNSITLENYYSENGETLEIALEPELSPSKNAQRYFKKYNKACSGAKQAEIQLQNTLDELNYLQNTLFWLENADTLEEVNNIKEELIKEGYITLKNPKNKNMKKAKKNLQKPQPLSYTSQDNFVILVGKNNIMNDYLTLKIAKDSDLWLHAKNMPGSHVIIRSNNKPIPETTILEAALLAAYYSKGKNSTNVPIDYTFKKNVKKPRNAKPGMVIYTGQKTIYVTPELDNIMKITKS